MTQKIVAGNIKTKFKLFVVSLPPQKSNLILQLKEKMNQLNNLIFFVMGVRHMWHAVRAFEQDTQAVCPHMKATERGFCLHITQFISFSMCSILLCILSTSPAFESCLGESIYGGEK